MSCFNFETFGAGHMPPFGFSAKEKYRKTVISDDIEDVEYEDITDQPEKEKSPAYDKKARAKQMMDFAFEKAKKDYPGDPIFYVLFATMFAHGGEWADDNPSQKFNSEIERRGALLKHIENKFKETARVVGEKLNPESEMLYTMIVSLGYHWATENPPKYKV